MVVRLSRALERTSEVPDHEGWVISGLGKGLETAKECECARIFETPQDKCCEAYRMSDRVDLAAAIVCPLVRVLQGAGSPPSKAVLMAPSSSPRGTVPRRMTSSRLAVGRTPQQTPCAG